MTRVGRLAVLPLSALLLTGCGADPAQDRRSQVAAVTEAANAGDADRLREQADLLLATVARQQEQQEVATGEADRLLALAERVRTHADVIDAELVEQRRREAEAAAAAQAEREQLERERARLEAEREQLEQDRKDAEQDRKDEDEDSKGKDKDDKDD